MIQIDPDDTELKESIYRAQQLKTAYDKADKAWDRSETRGYIYGQQFDLYSKAREAYESELINLALIVLERL